MTGYFLFAELIGKFPQLNIYRRFDDLTARTILYQQAGLLHLEAEQRSIINWEKQQINEAGFDQSWLKIKDAPEGTAEEFQRRKAVEIQSKLKEYRPLLAPPSPKDIVASDKSQMKRFCESEEFTKSVRLPRMHWHLSEDGCNAPSAETSFSTTVRRIHGSPSVRKTLWRYVKKHQRTAWPRSSVV